MSRKIYKSEELDLLERWGYKYIASVASNYYASTYYKVRAIIDLRECNGIVKDCPSVTIIDNGINWDNTVLTCDIGEVIKILLREEDAGKWIGKNIVQSGQYSENAWNA